VAARHYAEDSAHEEAGHLKVKMVGIRHEGNGGGERVVLKVLQDVNSGRYVMLDSTFDDAGKISNKHRHVFWFPKKPLAAGDFVGYTLARASLRIEPTTRRPRRMCSTGTWT
jgi:hypothetical protein